jgi:nucleotide-binding universal stress UspA family protein
MSDAIAVGVDGTAASRAALEWAIHRAEADSRGLALLHAVGNTDHVANERDSLVRPEFDFARAFFSEVAISFETLRGETVKALAEEAPRFELLVVGTHKTGFLRGRAFGSTSLRLAAVLGTPLAVIPISSGRSRRGVLVGIDDNLNSVSALRRGAGEAIRQNSLLTLVHAAQRNDSASPLSSALELVGREYPDLEVRAREVRGNAGEVLINAAATAAVLIIGGPTARPGLGAVTYDVLLNIAGPTILVPLESRTARAN